MKWYGLREGIMLIVEIIGAPGVGKSSILNSLRKRQKKNSLWVLDQDLLPRLTMVQRLTRVSRRWFGLPFPNLLASADRRFVEQNQQFVCHLWEAVNTARPTGGGDLDLRFRKVSMLYSKFAKVQILRESSQDRTVLIDEGLCKHLGFLGDRRVNDATLQALILDPVMPGCFLWVDAPGEVIADRVLHRRKVATVHRGLSRAKIVEYSKGSRAGWRRFSLLLQEFGKQVHRIDASEDGKINARIIEDLLERWKQEQVPEC